MYADNCVRSKFDDVIVYNDRPEYDYPLGEPTGVALRQQVAFNRPPSDAAEGNGDGAALLNAIRYERNFTSGTRVTLELAPGATSAGTACIYWGNGKITGDAGSCSGGGGGGR